MYVYIDRDLLETSFLILWLIYIAVGIIEGIRETIQNTGIPKLSVSSIKRGLKNILFCITVLAIVLVIPTLIIYVILKILLY